MNRFLRSLLIGAGFSLVLFAEVFGASYQATVGSGTYFNAIGAGSSGSPYSAEVVPCDGTTVGQCQAINSSGQAAIQSLPSQYPAGATALTASATGTTAATTATLTGVASNYMYLCGLSIRANATAAATGNATVTGTITGTMNFTQWTAPNASGVGVTEEVFTPCVQSSATNTSIAVASAAPGSGGTVSVSAWGYYKTTAP